MEKYILALDQGTTGSKAVLFDKDGKIKAKASKEFRQIYPKSGWVEHDAIEIWSTQLGVIAEAMAEAGIDYKDIAAIGITNQRETTIIWDKKTGKPIYHAIVWQCRRTADRIERLKEDGLSDYVKEKTGLYPDAYFSASKIEWILDHVDGARERAKRGELAFGTVDTWLMFKLSGGKIHATDYTNASRTMLFDIENLCWDTKLLEYFNIPKEILPEVKPSSHLYGYTGIGIIGVGIPIASCAGDQQAALFGQNCFLEGEAKNTYGTGCFLLMNTGSKKVTSKSNLITTIAADTGDISYALEGSVFIAGALVKWLRDELELIRDVSELETLAKSVADNNGVYIVPAFTGLGAPYWDQYARGCIMGLTRGANKAHIVRAALEAIAYQVNDILKAMEEDSGIKIERLRVDGGAASNDFLLQFQADILDTEVLRPECIEITALGAAYLAGLCIGYWTDKDEIRRHCHMDKSFLPDMQKEYRTKVLQEWRKAIQRSLQWEE